MAGIFRLAYLLRKEIAPLKWDASEELGSGMLSTLNNDKRTRNMDIGEEIDVVTLLVTVWTKTFCPSCC